MPPSASPGKLVGRIAAASVQEFGHARKILVSIASLVTLCGATSSLAADTPDPPNVAQQIADLKAANDQLRTLIPSQSHAMMDVAYHFTNLWFAGQQANWPLAQFYFNEARSHRLRAVPPRSAMRKVSSGELHLQEMFDAFDKTLLADVKKRDRRQEREAVQGVAYRGALEGCNACHTAAETLSAHRRAGSSPRCTSCSSRRSDLQH